MYAIAAYCCDGLSGTRAFHKFGIFLGIIFCCGGCIKTNYDIAIVNRIGDQLLNVNNCCTLLRDGKLKATRLSISKFPLATCVLVLAASWKVRLGDVFVA